MANFFVNTRYIKDQSKNTPILSDFIVSGEVKGDEITLSQTNQLSFKKETWTENLSDYLPVEYIKFQGWFLV